jgi:hypothetical protein
MSALARSLPGSLGIGRRIALLVCSAAIAVGIGAARPAAAVAASCPDLPLNVSDLVALQRLPGPLAKAFPLGVTPMNERALACFGRRELTLAAFVNRPDGIGGASAFAITPSWIVSGNLIVFGSAREVSAGFGDGPFFFVSTRPSAGDVQRRYARRWVTIRGHFDDPAAATCRASGPADVTPSKTQAVAICRTMFVLTSIQASGMPDTATSPGPGPGRPTADRDVSMLWLTWLVALAIGLVLLRQRSTATDDRVPHRRGSVGGSQ